MFSQEVARYNKPQNIRNNFGYVSADVVIISCVTSTDLKDGCHGLLISAWNPQQ